MVHNLAMYLLRVCASGRKQSLSIHRILFFCCWMSSLNFNFIFHFSFFQTVVTVITVYINFTYKAKQRNMDLLQRELERKKQSLAKAKEEANLNGDDGEDTNTTTSKKRKYIRQGDLRRIEEEEAEELERQKKQKLEEERQQKKQKEIENIATPAETKKEKRKHKKLKDKNKSSRNDKNNKSLSLSVDESNKESRNDDTIAQDTSPLSITRQLRQFGLVIRYFGEKNEERLIRLKEAKEERMKALQGLSEMEEYRLAKGQGHTIRNPFLERDKDSQQKQLLEQKKKKKVKTDGNDTAATGNNKDGTAVASANAGDKNNDESKNKDDEDDQSDPPKFIYKYLKGLLKEWEQDLADRPESVARSVAGRNESKTLKQCKDYIRPLFKLLKSRTLEDGLQFHLMKIVTFAKEGEFVKAHDAYMDVSIGRSAWPIGVTMVGIHARSGRAKIESANVAHVMNSELQRKYLTSVKRLLSYAQKKRVDVDPSKKVM